MQTSTPHAIAMDMYVCKLYNLNKIPQYVCYINSSDQKMRKIVLEKYFIDIKQEKFMRKMNIDNYVILLKG